MQVIDKSGEWVVNTSQFRMVDPTHGEGNLMILEPGIATKVIKTDWMRGQDMIEDSPDPLGEEAIPVVKLSPENTVVPTDPETKEQVLSAAPGIQGTAGAVSAKVADTAASSKHGGRR